MQRKIYAFDVDETLEISGGPITFVDLIELSKAGHILGLCGNWGVVTRYVNGWHYLFSFFNVGIGKAEFLAQVKMYVPAEDYVMVGNILGISGASDDQSAAGVAGWRFIQESDFARGSR